MTSLAENVVVAECVRGRIGFAFNGSVIEPAGKRERLAQIESTAIGDEEPSFFMFPFRSLGRMPGVRVDQNRLSELPVLPRLRERRHLGIPGRRGIRILPGGVERVHVPDARIAAPDVGGVLRHVVGCHSVRDRQRFPARE